MNDIKHADCFGGLVGLQLSDQVENNPRIQLFQLRPFCLGFLNTVLAVALMSGPDERFYFANASGFGHGDQRDVRWDATGKLCSSRHLCRDFIQPALRRFAYRFLHSAAL